MGSDTANVTIMGRNVNLTLIICARTIFLIHETSNKQI